MVPPFARRVMMVIILVVHCVLLIRVLVPRVMLLQGLRVPQMVPLFAHLVAMAITLVVKMEKKMQIVYHMEVPVPMVH